MTGSINFGDSELRYLGFSLDGVTIKIWLPTEELFVTITLLDVDYIVFDSNNMQNIIDALNVYDNWSEAMSDKQFATSDILKKFDTDKSKNNSKIFFITPITGIECIILFRQMIVE